MWPLRPLAVSVAERMASVPWVLRRKSAARLRVTLEVVLASLVTSRASTSRSRRWGWRRAPRVWAAYQRNTTLAAPSTPAKYPQQSVTLRSWLRVLSPACQEGEPARGGLLR